MLVDKDNGDIFPLLSEVLERFLDRGSLSLRVYHKEVSLGICAIRDMLQCIMLVVVACLSLSGCCALRIRTPTPARRRPVTELEINSQRKCLSHQVVVVWLTLHLL